MGKGMIAKKAKSNIKGKTYKQGRDEGMAMAIELFAALLMQDYGFTASDIKKFCEKVADWASYAHQPELAFYISTVRRINKENGIDIRCWKG